MTRPIIIIEDDLDDQEILREIFDELEMTDQVRFFSSCLAVLDFLMKTIVQPLIIISDINVPQMTGIELKQKLENLDHLRNSFIPFIFLTTTGDQLVINRAFETAPQGYFVKPTSVGAIKETIQIILKYWNMSKVPHSN